MGPFSRDYSNKIHHVGTCIKIKKHSNAQNQHATGQTCNFSTLQVHIHVHCGDGTLFSLYLIVSAYRVACAGPEVVHTNWFELCASGFGQYQASSAALANEREIKREGGKREHNLYSYVGPWPLLINSIITYMYNALKLTFWLGLLGNSQFNTRIL